MNLYNFWLISFICLWPGYFLIVIPWERFSYLVRSERIDRWMNTIAYLIKAGIFINAASMLFIGSLHLM